MGLFTDLPAELKLDIFERIPAREIQRCRIVCKDFRDTIYANTPALSRDICAREVARPQAKVDYVFDYDPHQVTFQETSRHWCDHRGICKSYRPRDHDLRQFAKIYLLKNCVRGGLQTDRPLWQLCMGDLNFKCSWSDSPEEILELLYEQLIDITYEIVTIFGQHHEIEGFKDGRSSTRIKQSFLHHIDFRVPSVLPGLEREGAEELYEAAIGPSRFFRGTLRSMEEQEAVLLHMRPVTTLNVETFRRGFARRGEEHSKSACSMSDLTRTFGVPILPWRDLGRYTVAYCVKNNWAGNELSWRELGGLENGLELEPLKKAACLSRGHVRPLMTQSFWPGASSMCGNRRSSKGRRIHRRDLGLRGLRLGS